MFSDQRLPDTSPTLEYRGVAGGAGGSSSVLGSENNSIKGSTTSLVTQTNNSRLSTGNASTALAGGGGSQQDGSGSAGAPLSGSVAQLSTLTFESKKSASSLARQSVKDGNNNRKDPTNSTLALFLLAEVSAARFFEKFMFRLEKMFTVNTFKTKSDLNEKTC